MSKETRNSILIIISNQFACLNMIHSTLLKELHNEFKITILSDIISDSELFRINNHYSININKLDFEIKPEGKLTQFVRKIEKFIFFQHYQIRSYKIKQMANASFSNHCLNVFYSIIKQLKIDLFILNQCRRFIIYLCKHYDYPKALSQFDGIISTSPLDIRENIIINQARKHTRTMGIIISWDNLTTKGLINANHDTILVWNKWMYEQYDQIYSKLNIPKTHIKAVGIPRFDIYFKERISLKTKATFLEKCKYSEADKIILFTTSAYKHFPNQVEILQDLILYSEKRMHVKILVRFHPADCTDNYQIINGHENVKIFNPTNQDFIQNQIPQLNYLDSLRSMLQNCSVCVQVASTIRLDAAACRKPIISIAYDGTKRLKYANSVRRFYDYDHQIPFNELKIDHRVHSQSQLFLTLDDILSSKQSPNQYNIAEFTYYTKPDAVANSFKNVQQWLS